MHGLVNRAMQGFLVETYGRETWESVRLDANLDFDSFEPMLRYDPALAERVIFSAAYRLDKSPGAFLEDVGTWIVANPGQDGIRRLLRFGGADYREFLYSLDELPGRAQMALPDLDVPEIRVIQAAPTRVELRMDWAQVNLSAIFHGALRAMADDYGALVLMELEQVAPLSSVIEVKLLDTRYAEGRSFSLGGGLA